MHSLTLHPNNLQIGTQVQNFVLNNPMIAFLKVLFYIEWTPQFVDFDAENFNYFWLISCCKGLETDIKKNGS